MGSVLFALGNRHPADPGGLFPRRGRLTVQRFHGGHFAIAAEPLPDDMVILWAAKGAGESPSQRLLAMAFAVRALREWHGGPLCLAHAYCDYSRANQPSCLDGYGQLIRSLPVDRHLVFDLHREEYLRHWQCPTVQCQSLALWAGHFCHRSPAIDLVVSPDRGRAAAARELAILLGAESLALDKTADPRPSAALRESVAGRHVLLCDDEIVGGRTLRGAIGTLTACGAASISPAVTYALCPPATLGELGRLPSVERPAVSDLIFHRTALPCTVVPMAGALLHHCLKPAGPTTPPEGVRTWTDG
jgi:phosphoribosylpyrophosphate synthetase